MRDRISKKLMGHKQTPEQIEKRASKLRGRKMPAGFSEAASIRMKGRKLPENHCTNLGKAKAKLSDESVRQIRDRRSEGEKRSVLSAEFEVDPSSITNITRRISYRWVI